jgi:hypothetical protein
MKKVLFAFTIVTAALVSINAVVAPDKDPLHGKKYETQATEYKEGVPKAGGKPYPDKIEFSKGRIYSDLAADSKMGSFNEYIKYEIEKDSTYTIDDEERHYYQIKASKENDDGSIITIDIIIDDIDMEGSMKLTKKDKVKKHYEFVGKEVAKKKK